MGSECGLVQSALMLPFRNFKFKIRNFDKGEQREQSLGRRAVPTGLSGLHVSSRVLWCVVYSVSQAVAQPPCHQEAWPTSSLLGGLGEAPGRQCFHMVRPCCHVDYFRFSTQLLI